MSIAVINSSTVVSDADGQTMVIALNQILPRFCSDWRLPTYTAVYVGKRTTTTIPIKIFILDTADIQDALGYHSLRSNVPYGKCFAKTVLDAGGAILYSPTGLSTVAQVVAHEIFELLIDPQCNGWWDIGDGETLIARETADPVQGNDVIVQVTTPSKSVFDPKTRKTIKTPGVIRKVGLSDWILPAWANPQNTTGPFNYLKTLKAPFTLDSGGYTITITNAQQGQVFAMKCGSAVSEEQKEKYAKKSSRLSKRTT